MSTTEELLRQLTERCPTESESVPRLGCLLKQPGAIYEARQIYEAIRPTSERAFMCLLLEATALGLLATHVVVQLPDGEVLGRFVTITDVPLEMARATGEPVRLHIEHIHVKYMVRTR